MKRRNIACHYVIMSLVEQVRHLFTELRRAKQNGGRGFFRCVHRSSFLRSPSLCVIPQGGDYPRGEPRQLGKKKTYIYLHIYACRHVGLSAQLWGTSFPSPSFTVCHLEHFLIRLLCLNFVLKKKRSFFCLSVK